MSVGRSLFLSLDTMYYTTFDDPDVLTVRQSACPPKCKQEEI